MQTASIFVVADTGADAFRRVLTGILRYGMARPERWSVAWDRHIPDHRVDGLLIAAIRPDLAETAAKLGVPTVNFSTRLMPTSLPDVRADDRAIGGLAASFFTDRLHRHFAFVGIDDHYYSLERKAGFLDELAEYQVAIHDLGGPPSVVALRRFLRALPTGTAVFAANDYFARQVTREATAIGRNIPDELSVLGVDAAEMLSMSVGMVLSSIDPDFERIGFEAARLLDQLMLDQAPPHRLLVPPARVVEGATTSHAVCEDLLVRHSLELIRDRACAGLRVQDVVSAATVSRRSLERRFRQSGASGIDAEIRRRRIERARELLVGTELSIAQVAENCGFSSVYYFSAAFRKETGVTATAYRRRHKLQ